MELGYVWGNRTWYHLSAPHSKKNLTIIYSSSIDTANFMFLEPFDWDHMTSIMFVVSHVFKAIFGFFWKEKVPLKWLLSFACILPSIPFWKCWRCTMFHHLELPGAMYGQKVVLLKKVFSFCIMNLFFFCSDLTVLIRKAYLSTWCQVVL